jgi:hypothetical protein
MMEWLAIAYLAWFAGAFVACLIVFFLFGADLIEPDCPWMGFVIGWPLILTVAFPLWLAHWLGEKFKQARNS